MKPQRNSRCCQRPTILLLSATAGYGHVKAGCDLAVSLRARFPAWHIVHENVFEFARPIQRWIVEKGWQTMSCTPILRSIYSLGYRKLVASDATARVVCQLYGGLAHRLEQRYADSDIRAVIALHPVGAAVGVHWKRKRQFILGVVATDLIVHAFQALSGVDIIYLDDKATLVSSGALEARRNGRVRYTGLPVAASFFKTTDVQPSRRTNVLVCFGATGLRAERNLPQILHAAVKLKEADFTFVCGQNVALFRKTNALVTRGSLHDRISVIGFCNNMRDRIASSDLIIGKPGGITVGEAIAQKKPFLIIDLLPGQEEYNAKALLHTGIGYIAINTDEIVQFVRAKSWVKLAEICRLKNRPGGIEEISNSLEGLLANDERATIMRENQLVVL